MFTKHEDAKKAGWFSRRHRTDEAHRAAKAQREAKHEHKRNREAIALAAFKAGQFAPMASARWFASMGLSLPLADR